MCVKFWSFLSDFCVHLSDFRQKLDFAIKNHCFWSFFDVNFDQFFINFITFLGSFLGFLGGYPSPSISAPLVVKKCPKLYIYNIGYGIPAHNRPLCYSWYAKAPMVKLTKCIVVKNVKGRTRVDEKVYPVNLPDM